MTDTTSNNNNNSINNSNSISTVVLPGEQSLLLPTNRRASDRRERGDGEGWSRCLVYSVGWIVCGLLALSVCRNFQNKSRAQIIKQGLDNTNQNFHTFPDDFVWGSATSSYQIEGAVKDDGRGPSIWDTFCQQPGNVLNQENGDMACDHYHRVDADVTLMKGMGLKAYRFSIAWPRILPNGEGQVNQAGIDFYSHLIDKLIENNIVPWITLYHWDLPQALEDKYGGWLSRNTVTAFGEYARICFEAYGDRVKHWITLNESWTVAVNGYNNAIHAPGHSKYPASETYLVAHHLLLAHANAVSIFRSDFARKQSGNDGIIGISNCADFRYPRSTAPQDEQAAQRAMIFQLGWFTDPIWKGDYPEEMKKRLGDRLPKFTLEEQQSIRGSSDFFGLNHYSSLLAAEPIEEPGFSGYWADMFVNFSANDNWKQNQMGWSVVPDGCRKLLLWIAERYDQPVIYMTENGSASDEPDLETAMHDYERRDYFKYYIQACAEAMDAGVDLRGYFAWSLMDNFEWQFGYQRRFGLCRTDFVTLERTPKASALWYRDTIFANGSNLERRKTKSLPVTDSLNTRLICLFQHCSN